MSAEAAIAKYIELRDLKAQRKKQYETDIADIDAAMDRIEAAFRVKLNKLGAGASIKTDAGTVYTSTLTSAGVANWDECLAWIKEHGCWDMLERRVAKSSVEQYRVENNDLPPGVTWSETVRVNIRR